MNLIFKYYFFKTFFIKRKQKDKTLIKKISFKFKIEEKKIKKFFWEEKKKLKILSSKEKILYLFYQFKLYK